MAGRHTSATDTSERITKTLDGSKYWCAIYVPRPHVILPIPPHRSGDRCFVSSYSRPFSDISEARDVSGLLKRCIVLCACMSSRSPVILQVPKKSHCSDCGAIRAQLPLRRQRLFQSACPREHNMVRLFAEFFPYFAQNLVVLQVY